MVDLLDLPERSAKPRTNGITHVIDRGLSLAGVDSLIEVAGAFVDIVKLGWGTALRTGNLGPKLSRFREHGIPVVLGGTLTELAISQYKVEPLVAWIHELGIEHIEISDGMISIDRAHKLELIERLSREFTVLSEVGSKDDTEIMAPYMWVEQIQEELAAGAWKVILEARESGTVGLYRHDGEPRMGLIDEIVHAVELDRLLFEAPRKDQQVWLVRRFGANVNLGNIKPDDVLSLETIRVGLRFDTAGGAT